MNWMVFALTFIILVFAHTLGDFGPKRKYHWFYTLNPFHYFIDLWRPHAQYSKNYGHGNYQVLQAPFWRALQKDQLLHILSHLPIAFLAGMIL